MSFWSTVLDKGDIPYGKRRIPTLIDEIAETSPERICFSLPVSSNLADGFRDIDFRTFANAINKTAYFIQQEIGPSSMFETVMYMGSPDIRYYIVLVALMKTGHKVLFSSHQNNIAVHADLIEKTECNILLHTSDFPVSGILETCRMETLVMPELAYLLGESPSKTYPFSFSWGEAKNRPTAVCHTSGSTGTPTAVVWPHSAFLTLDAHHLSSKCMGREVLWKEKFDGVKRVFNALPVFSASGLAGGLSRALFNGNIVVLGPPGPCTADTFGEMLEHGDIDAAACLPVTLEEIARRPDLVTELARLKYIAYVGGPLSKIAGDLIARHVQLYDLIASTLTSSLLQHATDPEDWEYVCLDPTQNGIEFRATSEGAKLYELVFVKSAALELVQGVFKVFPKLEEYAMSDLFSRHPTKNHHWKYVGRKENMIVFRNGWHFNPLPHENLISSHPAVQHCMLVGNGRDEAAALVELRDDYDADTALNEIWLWIEQANEDADPSSQLRKQLVVFTTKEKPMVVSNNGTVQRRATVRLYEAEIARVYQRLAAD